jgi:hypothetical protein
MIVRNVVSENRVNILGGGGGICCSGSPQIMDNIITGNSAVMGGGIICVGWCYPVLTNNIIQHNIALYAGGGIYGIKNGIIWITNNIIYGNRAANRGGGIGMQGAELIVTNSIVRNNSAGVKWAQIDKSGHPQVTYCNVMGGFSGPGNIDADPMFVDPEQGDFHILYSSPCRDAGYNDAAALPDFDFEGDPRIADGTVDMGVDEFHTHLYFTGKAEPGLEIEVKTVGTPGKPVLLFLGKDILDPPWPTPFGLWYLGNPITTFDLGIIPWKGLITLPARIPPDFPASTVLPLQALIQDVLTNVTVIEVEY